jgi:pimeloyl-ACP methyl ester carboxylesterase
MNVTVHNASIFVQVQGSGAPTLFLHGNPDSSLLWQGVISEVQSRLQCFAPDLPGFGRSELPAGSKFSLEEMAQFIDDLISASKISGPLNLVVHDFGGIYGLAWAVKHPQRVRRLAIMNTNFFSDYKWHIWGKIWRTWPLGELSMATLTWPAFYLSMHKASPQLTREHLRETYQLFTPAVRRMVLQLYRATEPENYQGWQDQLLLVTRKAPTCVLWGDRDPYISPGFAERFGAQKVWHYPANGHWLPAESPEQVAARLLEFFIQ